MLNWGGSGQFFPGQNQRVDAAAYNPVSNLWRPINTNGAPSPRSLFAYAWTGTELIVWGGMGDGFSNLATGGRYNVASDTWTPINTNGAPSPRFSSASTWTSAELIIWGGATNMRTDGHLWTNAPATGARYNPQTDVWTAMNTNNAPSARMIPESRWTGNKMVIWGGQDTTIWASPGRIGTVGTGALYDPTTDSWIAMSMSNAPISRAEFSSAWIGNELWVWGGRHELSTGQVILADGARYNPQSDVWTVLTQVNTPVQRANATAIWTGRAVLIFGGYNGSDLNTHHAWFPPTMLYMYQRR
jgi:N-acetylneuraminic acid mutarotase